MSLCNLMISDFMHGTGRFDPFMGDEAMYSLYNLEQGIIYAEGLIEDGFEYEPFYSFKLKEFLCWCKKRMMEIENDQS